MEPWLVGMQLTMLGCFCSAVGLVLMKHSTDTESHKPLHERKFWMMGFVFLFINASVIDVFAFSLAPITLVAPFTGVTIVFTTWLASSGLLFVKEELDIYDATSTGVTLAGVTVTSIYGPHSSAVDDANVLYANFSQSEFLVCGAVLLGVLGIGWAGAGLESAALLHGARDPKPLNARQGSYRILLYAYTAALVGSMSMLLLKVIGTGVRAKLEHGRQLLTHGWLACFAGLIACAAVQLTMLHRTLANSPVSYGVPTYQTLLTILTILVGGIFFSEFDTMDWFTFFVFGSGVGLALFGIALHTSHRSRVSVGGGGAPGREESGHQQQGAQRSGSSDDPEGGAAVAGVAGITRTPQASRATSSAAPRQRAG